MHGGSNPSAPARVWDRIRSWFRKKPKRRYAYCPSCGVDLRIWAAPELEFEQDNTVWYRCSKCWCKSRWDLDRDPYELLYEIDGFEVWENLIDDAIDAWHKASGEPQTLPEWLGMTWEQYKHWAEDPLDYFQEQVRGTNVGQFQDRN